MMDLDKIVGFDWDNANIVKILNKHGVTCEEAQQVFGDENVLLLRDVKHSQNEPRFQALGRTQKGRHLSVVFTLRREDMIRVISARAMSRKERHAYD